MKEGQPAWNDGTRDSLVMRYRVPTAPLASDAMTASACPPCWGRFLALGGTSRQSIISAKSASLLSLLQRKRPQTEAAQKRAAQCDGGYPSSEKKETNFAMSFPLPCAAYWTEDRRRDAPRRFGSSRYEASAAFAAIVAWASSSKAIFVAASRLASMSSMGLFAPIGEVDMKSAPGTVRASRTYRRSDQSRP